jgi:hypothetical protein
MACARVEAPARPGGGGGGGQRGGGVARNHAYAVVEVLAVGEEATRLVKVGGGG